VDSGPSSGTRALCDLGIHLGHGLRPEGCVLNVHWSFDGVILVHAAASILVAPYRCIGPKGMTITAKPPVTKATN
jgi:hypothetical protein